MDDSRRARLWVLVVLVAGAALPLLGVLADPTSRILGAPLSDAGKHVWGFWHTLAQVADGTWPGTRYLNAPFGGTHLDVMWLPALLMAPLTWIGGPILSANAWLFLTLLAVGGATYALCLELSASRSGSCAGAVMTQSCPYLLGYPLASGVYERAAIWVFPLVLLCFLRLRDGGSRKWILLGAGGLLVSAAGCQVYGVFTLVMLLLALPWLLGSSGVRARALRLLPALAALLGVLALLFFLTRLAFLDPGSVAPQPGRLDFSLGVGGFRETNVWPQLLDPRFVQQQQPRLRGDLLWIVAYLGWVPLLAAGLGALGRGERRVGIRWCVVTALLMALLSLGDRLPIGEQGLVNPLFHAVSWVVPFYGHSPPLWQQVGAFAPLIAVGVAGCVALAPSGRARVVMAVLLVAGALWERAWVLPVSLVVESSPVHLSSGYEEPREGNLVEIPRVWQGSTVARPEAFLAQTRHRRPAQMTINVGVGPLDRYGPVRLGRAEDWSAVADCLRRGGFGWLVFHSEEFEEGIAQAAALREALGPPDSEEENTWFFDLSRGGEVTILEDGVAWPQTGTRVLHWESPPGGLAPGTESCPFESG